MGFFGALGKIIQGKPVFEPNNNQPAGQQQSRPLDPTGQTAPQPQAAQGPKQPPQIIVEQVECHTSGTHMDCTASIKNHSNQQVDLDRLNLLGTTHDMGTFLRPGEEREFRIYSGNRPNNTSYTRAELQVKDHTGDYWQVVYYIEFKAVGDGTYIIERMRSDQVRDI